MTDSLEATNLDLALDICLDFTAKVTFDSDILINPSTKFVHFFVGEVANASVGTDAKIGTHPLSSRFADAKNVGKRNLQTLFAWDVYSRNTGHAVSLFSSQP